MFRHILEILIFVLNGISILILIWGVFLTFYNFLKYEFTLKNRLEIVKNIGKVKNYLGLYILLGLEILICADIIESILNPTLHEILILASIVIIRTVISYYLNKEIKSDE